MDNFKIRVNGTIIMSNDICKFLRKGQIRKAQEYIINTSQCCEQEAKNIVDELVRMSRPKSNDNYVKSCTTGYQDLTAQFKSQQTEYVPHCPTCGSPNIEKISIGKKMKGSFFFGFMSKDVRSTFHCKNCGYKW